MFLSLNDLVGFSAKATDFQASVVDVFVERKSWRVSHVVLDTGGLFEKRLAAISSSAISDVSPKERTLRVDLTKEQAEAQQIRSVTPRLKDGDVSALPELIFGPDEDAVRTAFFSTIGAQDQYFSFVAAASSKAANTSEAIGSVIGFIADADTMTATHITVDTGIIAPKSQHVLPVSLVKEVGSTDRETVLTVDRKTVGEGPELEQFDGLDRHWTNRVASYYGLA